MYTVIRNYQHEASDVVEEIRAREEAVREVLGSIEGFVAYSTRGRCLRHHQRVRGQGGSGGIHPRGGQVGRGDIADWTPNPPSVIQGEVAITLRA